MIKQQPVLLQENMSNLTSAVSGVASVSYSGTHQQECFSQQNDQSQDQQQAEQPPAKKRRSLPGNPDPDAEVIALSPKTLLATNRFVCEICNKGFQRDQNLQLHRRGHNLPWKLKQRTSKEVKKKVYVCPEPSCVHHDPARALGDLTGIKKHFCRKHGEKKWKCDKCSKKYAVQSDWKAHSKICGTREYRCDCGTLFSRRDSYITHRAFCDALAEETTRAITTPPLLANPIAVAMAGTSSSSHHHLINQPQQSQAVFNPQLDNPLHSFVLIKREQNLINLPPWLDHHLSSSASASSPIFHQDHQQLMRQDNQNPSMGLIMTSASGGAPYHTQVPPEMSATALLQKAAQMGSTMSNTKNDPQGHVSGTNSSAPNTAGLFGVNLSSRDHHGLSSFGNKAAPPLPPPTTNFNTGGSSDQITGPTPSSSASMLHDMMINSLSSSSSYNPHDDAFGIGGMLKKEAPLAAFHQTLGGSDFRTSTNGGGGGGNEGLTRDFLGLRPLSQNDILTLAGLGNCITTNPTSHDHSQDHHHHHHHTHKPW